MQLTVGTRRVLSRRSRAEGWGGFLFAGDWRAGTSNQIRIHLPEAAWCSANEAVTKSNVCALDMAN